MACQETERVKSALSVGQTPYYMRKSVRQALTAKRAQQKRVERLPISEWNRKIVMSDKADVGSGRVKALKTELVCCEVALLRRIINLSH
jgi:hypothetical protein